MTRFTGSAHSANMQSGPEINDRSRPVPRIRAGGSLGAFTVSAVVLLLLLIFILQNGQRTEVHFFGAQAQLPMGVALLLAAVFGVLLVTIQAIMRRIIQLRPLPRRHRGAIVARPDPAGTDPDNDAPEGRSS
ncbi:lipopolysaccharide assembly protein LapA domain-containing protein [Polymorphospora lycopeni]|uniref:LapA family protein n=1 Tax=Polymorphospora lycopeni TaxID=3140240 RepID=A0ABV5D1S5_9ACTN